MMSFRGNRLFTLVELLIVMFLLIIIGTSMTIGTTKVIRDQRFKSSCDKIQSLLNTAQNIAMVYQENVTIKILPEMGKQYLICTLETEYKLNPSINKPVKIEGVSIVFHNKQKVFPKEKIELEFKNDYSSFPKGDLEISSLQDSSLNKKLYLSGYPQLNGVGFNETKSKDTIESHALYPKEVLENIDK